MELVRILANSEVYLPFLREKDATGLTVSEKILSIFDYRIPYYVGPLNRSSRFAWLERTDEKIYPWNFEQVVDLDRSAETFVRRMTAKCTYIHEDVLPKDSLLYSEFMVLNELNSLCVNGKRIPVELKKEIYRDLFLKGKKVTQKRLLDYLRARGLYNAGDSLSGIDGDFKSCLTSHRAFRNILERTGDTEMVEDLIQHIVLFGEDRKMLTRYVQKTYGDVLSPEDVRYVCKQKFSGWGRLSREFLTEIYHADRETGEAISIIEMMRDTNNNLMELLSRRFDFAQNVDAYNQEHSPMAASPREFVEKSYASPSIKRSILQAVGIVDEIVKIMGKRPPKRIFVEMAREDGEKNKRTIPRKAHLMELYEKCREEAPELFDRLSGCEESALRRDKLYLYYTQMGRCMYSGETIDLERLDSGYDIDHIYPQSKTKDDSMSNRVLVKRELNGQKGDRYPISQDIREAQRGFWKMLKERKLIDQKKFDRLTRSTPFTEDELAGFISRQLVETRQSSKLVAEILRHLYGEDRVVYVKAGNVAQFRQQADQRTDGTRTYDFVKCRSVNDLHHAKDAYLNIVVGNVYHLRFTKNPMTFLRSAEGQRYSLNRVFDYPVVRGGEVAWNPGEDGSMAMVRRTIRRNNVLFTRMAVEAGGGLFKVTILKKGKGQAAVKASDPRLSVENYGGYTERKGSFFFLVEHTNKKKRVRSIEPVYLMHEALYRRDPRAYCEQILEPALVEPVVLIPEIRVGALVSFDGFKMHVSGRTGSQIIYKNANQLVIAPEWIHYFKQIEKYVERCKKAGRELPLTRYDEVTDELNCRLYDVFLKKLSGTVYQINMGNVADCVRRFQDDFRVKTVYVQCNILLEIRKVFGCDAVYADLKAMNGSSESGKIRISKNLKNGTSHSYKLIHQSITGVFEQEVDLLGEISPKALRE